MQTPSETIKEFKDEWAQQLLDESYCNEFDVNFGQPCTYCSSKDETNDLAYYRCTECFLGAPMCKYCMVSSHCFSPFHRIERWTGTHLEKEFLNNIGLIIYLGHSGQPCSKASFIVETTIVHTSRIQMASISYCGCEGQDKATKPRPQQLIRSGLYLASFKRTSSAFSVAVLKQFYHLCTQGKLTAHDFIASLRRLTNYGFLDDSKDCYREFMMAYRQFCFLRSLRWSHRRADKILPEGSLAIECPACPQPKMNMDPIWKNCNKDLM